MNWVLILIIWFNPGGVTTTQIEFADEQSCSAALSNIRGQWLEAAKVQRVLINTCVARSASKDGKK